MQQRYATAPLCLLSGLAAAGVASAGVINVGDDVTRSTTWTADNTYNLTEQIYVREGATLTIEAGTVIASTPSPNGSGAIAVTRGSKIIARGTAENPIIFTSTADVATWDPMPAHPTGKNPETGNWRQAANEWGNLTIMGRAFVSNTIDVPGNSSNCNANNVSPMEGLVAGGPNDPNVLFGGGDDDDDSGALEYVSIRYGGRVLGVGDELNGLSLGGIGRETEIDQIEIMNNVDDGIEIWGGTVNIKSFSIWNVGDDSFDVDQGWRGKAQFGLIVQGYSLDAAQGSGVGDNCLEIDGAEKADAQPVTTCCFYNVTVIGQPAPGAGDHGIEMRDGARVQMRNFIFMDIGDRVLRNGITDGEGSIGYGFNGTLTFAQTFTTAYTMTSPVNACANPAAVYQAQTAGAASIEQGFLSEMTDTVFFRNLNSAYSNAAPNEGTNAMMITIGGGSNPDKGNVVIPGFDPPDAPIQGMTRAGAVQKGGTTQLRVTSLDPRANNQAENSVAEAPNDGFFCAAGFRGGFNADENWLVGWTAADAFGFLVQAPNDKPCVAIIECVGDTNDDGVVDVQDLTNVILAWGSDDPSADITGDGVVDVQDLTGVILAWGDCP